MNKFSLFILSFFMLSLAVKAGATIVTTPAGVLNNTGPSNIGDPNLPNTWLRLNVRNDGSVGISSNYPRNGSASVFFSLGANTGNNAKADWEYYPSTGFGRLADLQTLIYEWYRDATSQVPAHLHPVIRLTVDADGNLGTSNDRGYLVYERCYNVPSCPAVPVNTWVAENISSGSILWWVQFGVGIETVYTRNLATYQAGAYTPSAGFSQLNGNSLILGVSTGVGSGWVSSGAPSFLGAVDSITLRSNTPGAAQLNNHNFELATPQSTPAPVPTLGTIALALSSLILLLLAAGAHQRLRARFRS